MDTILHLGGSYEHEALNNIREYLAGMSSVAYP